MQVFINTAIPSMTGVGFFMESVFAISPLTSEFLVTFLSLRIAEGAGFIPLTRSAQVVPGAFFSLFPVLSKLPFKRADGGAGRLQDKEN